MSRLEGNPGEIIFGMGLYQQSQCDLKGCMLDLEQRYSRVSVPFEVSSLGYGFLWNNPAVGRVIFGENIAEWVTECSKEVNGHVATVVVQERHVPIGMLCKHE